MAQPPQYNPTTDFSNEEASGVAGRSTVRTAAIDAEHDAIKASITALITNIGLLQRDDGELKDGVLKLNAISAAVLVLLGSQAFTFPATGLAWGTARAYVVKDIVTNGNGTYVCAVAHTSGVFATDLTAKKWATIFDAVTYAASAITFTPTGRIVSTNVQSAVAEIDSDLAASSGASLSGFLNAGANAVASDVQTELRYFVRPEHYGAVGDGATDDSSAFTKAFARLATLTRGALRLDPAKTYKLASAVSFSNSDIVIDGAGSAKILTNGNNALLPTGSRVRIRGIFFDSAASAATIDNAIYGVNVNDVDIEGCRFGRVKIDIRGDTNNIVERLRVVGNVFVGSYTGMATAGTGIIAAHGVQDLQIYGNAFNVSNPERFIKITTSVNTYTDADVASTYRSKRVVIGPNIIRGSMDNGGQIIDLTTATSEVDVSKNIVDVSGIIGSFVDCRAGTVGDTSPQADTVTNISVRGNTGKLSGTVTDWIKIEGAWGMVWENLNIPQICNVSDNNFEHDDVSTTATILIKGMNYARVHHNVAKKNAVSGARFIQVCNCQISEVDDNQTNYGTIEVVGNGSSSGAAAYSRSPEKANIHDNNIENFQLTAGIYVASCNGLKHLQIHDNEVTSSVADSGTFGAAYRVDTCTVDYLNLHDNRAVMNNAAKARLQMVTTTPTKWVEHDNSWNSTTFTWDPANLVDGAGETSVAVSLVGAAFGCGVLVGAPYDLQGIVCTGYVSSADNVKARLQNETTGAIDLASGTWKISFVRHG